MSYKHLWRFKEIIVIVSFLYSSSLNVSTHPLLSVRETIVNYFIKIRIQLLVLVSGINNPFVSIKNNFKIRIK